MPDEKRVDVPKIFTPDGQIADPAVAHETANLIEEARKRSGVTLTERFGFYDAQSRDNHDLAAILGAEEAVRGERKLAEMEEVNKYDELTGLLKQKAYETAITESRLLVDQGLMKGFGLVRIDADRFSWVNDLGGHLFGNYLIQQMAKLMILHLRPKDRAFRVGHGDEIGLLFSDVNSTAVLSKLLSRMHVEVSRSLLDDTCEAILHANRTIKTEEGLEERDGVYTVQELYKGLRNFHSNIQGKKEYFRRRGKGDRNEKKAVIGLIDSFNFEQYAGLLLGDKYTLKMESGEYEDYTAVMRDFMVQVSRIFQQITVSMGGMVVTKNTPGSAIALDQRVDRLTYQAKHEGGGRVVIAENGGPL